MSRWTSRDFLLRNTFCPLPDIQATVDELRVALGLPWLMLLPYDSRDRLASLFMVSAADEGLVRAIRRRAASADFTDQSVKDESERSEASRFALTLLGAPEGSDVWMFRSAPDRDGEQPPDPLEKEAIGFIDFWIAGDFPPARDELSTDETEALLEQLNGTLIANSSRDGRISDLISEPARVSDYGRTIAGLLRLAINVSSGSMAAFYTSNPRDKVLLRSEIWDPSKDDSSEKIFPSEIDLQSAQLAGHLGQARDAFSRSRTFIWPAPEDLDADTVDWSYTAVPVPTSPLWGHRNAGILAVASMRGHIGQTDLALLRNVALRLSLLLNISATESSAHLVTAFGKRLSSQSNSVNHELDFVPIQGRHDVPGDIDRVRNELELIASHLRELTSSDSVTFRALMPMFEGSSERWVLRRFVAIPRERLKEGKRDLDISDWRRSVNAWVARQGRMAHLYDTRMPLAAQAEALESIEAVNPSVRSEVAFPVFSDGLLIGTMNLESSIPHAYSTQLESIAAVATLAGFAVSSGRREAVRAIAERFSLLGRGYHESGQLTLAIKELRAVVPEELIQTFESALVASKISPDRPTFAGHKPVRPVGLQNLVAQCSESNSYVQQRLTSSIEPDVSIPGAFAAPLREVIKEIFKNAKASRCKHVLVRSERLSFAGRDYRLLTIANEGRTVFSTPAYLQRLYRGPIPDSRNRGRPHLGCFTAGELARSIGGNIFAGIMPDGMFGSHVIFPEVAE